MSTTTSTDVPSATASAQPNANTGPSSPLLFFVALGFGVVFTNLWIIVGVKYCFRYNQRNRARLAGEDPDGVDLNAMPRQRRRREKKLMTMDEVNERFPLIKYKIWRSSRADQGLPTAGGITNAPSRPASIRNTARDSIEGRDKEPKTPTTINEKMMLPEHGRPEQVTDVTPVIGSTATATPTKTTVTPPEPALVRTTTNDEDVNEESDRIQTAIPAEQLPDPGDTCAICIDTIEDDDDIRGLTCGHAFHASCVDPWLTSRRACCPLCKADYYVPKPRPEGPPEEPRRNLQPVPVPRLWDSPYRSGFLGRTHNMSLSRAFLGSNRPEGSTQPVTEAQTAAPEITSENRTTQPWHERLRLPAVPALSRIRRGRGNEAGDQPAATTTPTPAQLEAGRS